jgi:hypothetical protein
MSRKLVLASLEIRKANITSVYCVYTCLKRIRRNDAVNRESYLLKKKGEQIKVHSKEIKKTKQ